MEVRGTKDENKNMLVIKKLEPGKKSEELKVKMFEDVKDLCLKTTPGEDKIKSIAEEVRIINDK